MTLHPSYFGRNMHDLVTTKLVKDVEGTCAGDYYIIAIMDTFDVSEGLVLPGSGLAEFTVGYRAVVWRPFKGEVVGRVSVRAMPDALLTWYRWMPSLRPSTHTASSPRPDLCVSSSRPMYGISNQAVGQMAPRELADTETVDTGRDQVRCQCHPSAIYQQRRHGHRAKHTPSGQDYWPPDGSRRDVGHWQH